MPVRTKFVRLLSVAALVWATFLPASANDWPVRIVDESFDEKKPSSGHGVLWRAADEVDWGEGFEGAAPRFSRERALIHWPLVTDREQSSWLNLQEGSLRFRFRPDWNSGEGPGGYASVVSVGLWTAESPKIGFWSVTFDPTGDRLIFSGQNEQTGAVYLTAPVKLQAGRWYDMLLSYSVRATWLYVDGNPIGPGNGIRIFPGEAVLQRYGLQLGNSSTGNQPLKGTIDSFEVYDRGLTGFRQRKDNHKLAIAVDWDERATRLTWNRKDRSPVFVRRRLVGTAEWQKLSPFLITNRFVDVNPGLALGQCYEYVVGQRRAGVAIGQLPPVERRGRVLLLVADSLSESLEPDLTSFRQDLIGDGWSVAQRKAPSHIASSSRQYRRRLQTAKSIVAEFYREAPTERNVVLLIGRVVVPYSGSSAEDGHQRKGDDHRGAWPCDAWYGDVDGVWTDETVSYRNQTYRANTNLPGDGKFDQNQLPSSLELAVGRIDFSRLPGIAGFLALRSQEEDSIRRYLKKNHDYRTGKLRFEERAAIKTYLPSPAMSQTAESKALHNGIRLFGDRENGVLERDCFQLDTPVALGFLAGSGGHASLVSGRYRTAAMGRQGAGPKAAFLLLYGSWIGDWNMQDNFLRAALCGVDGGLTAMSASRTDWNLTSLGWGGTLADCYLETANFSERPAPRSLAVLGDVTLRLQPLAPVTDLTGERTPEGVKLRWQTAEPGAGQTGFFVYRAASLAGPFDRISGPGMLRTDSFIDSEPPAGKTCYLVRRGAVVSRQGSSYHDLSQGRFLTVEP